jgi:DNA-binding MarR family transcriptional regulator
MTSPTDDRHADGDGDLGLVDALVQLSFAVQAVLGSIAARHDLSVTQVRMLGILRDREPAMLELARVLNLEKSSATGLVDRAQKRGLVERTTAEHDGRAVHVRLTADGRALVQRATVDVEAQIAALAAPLSPAERARLSRLASRLIADPRPRRVR